LAGPRSSQPGVQRVGLDRLVPQSNDLTFQLGDALSAGSGPVVTWVILARVILAAVDRDHRARHAS